MTTEELQKLVEEKIVQLMEHCDSVRVFVTVHSGEKDTTASFSTGKGNYYAQRGQISEWLSQQEGYDKQPAANDD